MTRRGSLGKMAAVGHVCAFIRVLVAQVRWFLGRPLDVHLDPCLGNARWAGRRVDPSSDLERRG